MDQFITLLSNLFNLTKVASVTLPGVFFAGALLIFFIPTRPIDTVRTPVILQFPKSLPAEEKPCSSLPPLEGGPRQGACESEYPVTDRGPVCSLIPISLNLFDDQSNFHPFCKLLDPSRPKSLAVLQNEINAWCQNVDLKLQESAVKNLCADAYGKSPDLRASAERLCHRSPWKSSSQTLAITGLFSEPGDVPGSNQELNSPEFLAVTGKISDFGKEDREHAWQPKLIKQFVLETTRDRLTQCADLEKAWQGQEDADNDQLKTDIANLDKQRSDIQDAYIASLKSNDRILSPNFRQKLANLLQLSDEYRARYRINLLSINERTRRLDDIKSEQDNISARLSEPGRLRPIKEFDVYAQSLLNHVVGLILLSLALSLILTAVDRTVLGNLFEAIFPGW